MTHTRFGAAAVKSRFSRSPARLPSLAGIVVRTIRPRRIPLCRSSLIARWTLSRETSWPWRRSSAVIFRRPYNPAGVSRNAPVALSYRNARAWIALAKYANASTCPASTAPAARARR